VAHEYDQDHLPQLDEDALTAEDVANKRFEFSWRNPPDGELHLNGIMVLQADGTIGEYRNRAEATWEVDEAGRLLIRHADGRITTVFNKIAREDGKLVLTGPFLIHGNFEHVLREQ